MDLQQLFYVSQACLPYDTASVHSVLSASRRNNRREDVTGCLLFSGRFFAQVLEGNGIATAAAVERIRLDSRQTNFRLMLRRPVANRAYGDWTMGYLRNLDLEDDVQALTANARQDPQRILKVMDRMRPDAVMGPLP